MVPLRYPMVWLLPGWGLVLLVTMGSVLPGEALGIEFSAADKLMHALAYFLIMVWFAGLYRKQRHVLIALVLVALGGVLELVQAQLPYRLFDPLDLLANTAGIVLGLGLSFALVAGWCHRVERLLGYHD